MNGRMEHTLRTNYNIKYLLADLPDCVSDFYYTVSPKLQPKTCEEYIRHIRRFLKFINDDAREIKVANIGTNDITRYLNHICQKTDRNGDVDFTSVSYKRLAISALSKFFKYLYNSGTISANPMDMGVIEQPTGKDNVKRIALTEEDIVKILETIDDEKMKRRKEQWKWYDRDKAIISLFVSTGMRKTALSEINIESVDLENNKVTIIDKRFKKHVCNYSDEVKRILIKWIDDRRSLMDGIDCEALFVSNRRERISEKAVYSVVKKYSKMALGFEISPHKLRASYCTILYKETGDIECVRAAVGHESSATTQRYIVAGDEAKERAAAIIGGKIFSKVK